MIKIQLTGNSFSEQLFFQEVLLQLSSFILPLTISLVTKYKCDMVDDDATPTRIIILNATFN